MSKRQSLPPLDQLRLDRGAEHLHSLGPRAVAEYIAELAGRIGGLPAAQGLLIEYETRLTPVMIRAAGAHRSPPRAMQAVPR